MHALIRSIAVASIVTGSASAGGLSLVSSFNPAEGGGINSIGYDQLAEEVYIHFNGNANFHIYATDGTFLRTLPKPLAGGNDDDIEFLTSPAIIGGVSVPVGTLISIENENDPPRIYAVSKADGSIITQQNYDGGAIGQWVGGAQASGETFYTVDWQGDSIQRVNSNSSVIEASFPVRPAGSPAFDIFYGDIDVLQEDGLIYAVSSSQNVIRALLPDGSWGGDFDITGLGITGMAGIAFDDARGEAWIAGQDNEVHRVAGFPPDGCVLADLAPPLGILDLADVGGFIDAFLAGAQVADLAAPFGIFDLADITTFIDGFLAGCP